MPKAKKKMTLKDQKPLTDPKGGRRGGGRGRRIRGGLEEIGGSETQPIGHPIQ